MPANPLRLGALVDRLRAWYGRPAVPNVTDPFEQILLEQVGYLASDDKRRKAFELLRARVGLAPRDILGAPHELLVEAAAAGGSVAVDRRAERMRESARIACDAWDGDLSSVLSLPHEKAVRVLAKFPMIGKPGAGKILLVAGATSELALDSNGLRVLLRMGYGVESERYDQAYRSVMEAIESQASMTADAALEAHLLLREHGRGVCRRTSPACPECPLLDRCPSGQTEA